MVLEFDCVFHMVRCCICSKMEKKHNKPQTVYIANTQEEGEAQEKYNVVCSQIPDYCLEVGQLCKKSS